MRMFGSVDCDIVSEVLTFISLVYIMGCFNELKREFLFGNVDVGKSSYTDSHRKSNEMWQMTSRVAWALMKEEIEQN